MPSWNDGESSSQDSLLSEFANGADLSPMCRVPETMYDPDYAGVHAGPERCHHHLPCHKYVAFDGTNTGRRFLGCGCKDNICETVFWVDQEWPQSLKRALLQLWHSFEEEKETRISGNVEYATANYQLVLEKRELEKKNLELHKQLGSLSTDQEGMVAKSAAELEKVMREKAELQIATLKEDKKKLEYYVADLFNIRDRNQKKMKAIQEISASWE
ncbi:uncharacterized protein [Lolium perenne]|uniref:uncharacterized protein n=1 Tax=Lolium perenne TaxID=4522 RepID=UPI003A999315